MPTSVSVPAVLATGRHGFAGSNRGSVALANVPRVLMVDDDRELCELVVRYLNDDGFEASAAHDGEDALRRVNERPFDVMILDVMMPGMGGQEVLRRLNAAGNGRPMLPVLMLTARGDEVDRVIGLETGADDYLAKPCSLRELAARLRAILRRVNAPGPDAGAPLVVGSLVVDPSRRTVEIDDAPVRVTGAEFAVLQSLASTPGVPVSKETLTRAALGREYVPYDRSIDVHIANLRKKLGGSNDVIRTIRGAGYLLLDPTA